MAVSILHLQSSQPLAELAPAVFEALDIGSFEERESSNYPDDVYFRGEIAGMEIRDALVTRLLADGYGLAREVGFDERTIEREVYRLRDGRLEKTRTAVRAPGPG